MSKFIRARKDPFDKFGQGAKIPDGKTNQSVGLRSTAAFEMTMSPTEFSELLIAPGLYQSIIPCSANGAANADPLKLALPTGPGVFGDIAIGEYEDAPPAGSFPKFTPLSTSTATYPHRWRLVSAGVRFSLLNNSDENEGWWECVRSTSNISDLQQDDINGKLASTTVPAAGTTAAIPGWLYTEAPFLRKKGSTTAEAANITSENTYVAGRMRDMHQLTFTLNSISNDHDFVEMKDDIHDVQLHFDKSYDMLNFRFHPRPDGTATAPSTPSKLVCHVAYNYEIEYQPGTLLAKMASAGWGGARNYMSKGDRMSPATVTRRTGWGMARARGGATRRPMRRRRTYTRSVSRKRTYKKRAVKPKRRYIRRTKR